MDTSSGIVLLCLVLTAAAGLVLAPSFSAMGNLRRVLRDWTRGRSRSTEVLSLAIRLRLLMNSGAAPELEPRFWVSVELDTMPERQMLNICMAYADLRAAGLSHAATIERLEIWRSRFGAANMGLRHESLEDYLRYRMRLESGGICELPNLYFRLTAMLFTRHSKYRDAQRRTSLLQIAPSLKRLLYVVRVNGPDLALTDSDQTTAVGWTDLERYLESDMIAARVLDGDEIWSYASAHSAGLALVRNGNAVELSELASFRNRRTSRRRPYEAR